MVQTSVINCEAVSDAFRRWQSEQEPVATELNESLAALSAYQSHLDVWHQQLVREREEIRGNREQLERERSGLYESANRLATLSEELKAAREEISKLSSSLEKRSDELRLAREQLERERAENSQSHAPDMSVELDAARNEIAALTAALNSNEQEARFAELTNELNAARDKTAALTTMLLTRTEELRALDVRRTEISTELELAHVRERELTTALDELREAHEREHAHWAEENRHLRELIERPLGSDVDSRVERSEQSATKSQRQVERSVNQATPPGQQPKNVERAADNPVFASVMEQFGKLRQQRAAMERPHSKKPR